MPHAIDAADLTKLYAPHAGVVGLDVAIPEGSLAGLIGPSGSGKTTTVRLFTGLISPDRGTVRVLGQDPIAFSRSTRTRVGYLPQNSVMYPELTIRENLWFAGGIHGMRRRDRKRRVRDLLEVLELGDSADTRLADASGGQRRRLGLAAALVHRPDLAFLDEPTAALDPLLRRSLWERFARLRDEGRTMFVTTQYVGEAANCDVILFLSQGRVVAQGSPEELRRRAFRGELLDVTFDRVPADDDLSVVAGRIEAGSWEVTGPRAVRFTVSDAGSAGPRIGEALRTSDLRVVEAERHLPDFDDVFVALVEQSERGGSS